MSGEDTGLITCCGLYRGDCFGYRNRVAGLARDLRKESRDSGFEKFTGFSVECTTTPISRTFASS